jgi:hypothetical protein
MPSVSSGNLPLTSTGSRFMAAAVGVGCCYAAAAVGLAFGGVSFGTMVIVCACITSVVPIAMGCFFLNQTNSTLGKSQAYWLWVLFLLLLACIGVCFLSLGVTTWQDAVNSAFGSKPVSLASVAGAANHPTTNSFVVTNPVSWLSSGLGKFTLPIGDVPTPFYNSASSAFSQYCWHSSQFKLKTSYLFVQPIVDAANPSVGNLSLWAVNWFDLTDGTAFPDALPSPTPLVRAVTQCDTTSAVYLGLVQQVAAARNWTLPANLVFVRVGTPFETVYKYALFYVWVGAGILGLPLVMLLALALSRLWECRNRPPHQEEKELVHL